MSGLSVSGIASGIDSDSIISQMVALETRSISNIQRRIALEEAERVLFQDLNTRLESLRGATNAFSARLVSPIFRVDVLHTGRKLSPCEEHGHTTRE